LFFTSEGAATMTSFFTFCARSRLDHRLPVLLAGAVALALFVSPARAQTTEAPAGTASSASVNSDDRDIMQDLAHAHHAEIEGARLALDKSQNERVRQFAQQMIDDHGQAQIDLQQLAQLKGVKLPQEANLAHKTLSTAMRLLPADVFDRQYIARMGVNDNQRTVEMLQRAQKTTKDAELQALLQRQLAMAEAHLTVARKLNSQKPS
jgi:putative membrane protein